MKRPGIRLCLAAVSAVLLVACGRTAGPPDVLVVTIDTLRADRLGCYGHAGGLTPTLDALARSSTLYEDASAPVPITLPSHTSLFTGRYPTATGVRNNGTFVVPASETTLAELLSGAGWDTAAVIASFPLHSRFGLDQGFRVYDDDLPSPGETVGPAVFFPERDADAVTDRAIALWRRMEGPARFLWVHYFDPHAPYAAPAEYASRFPDEPYDGEVAYVDAAVGRLIDAVEAGSDRLLVVVTSDHGESLGEHGEKTHGVFLYQSTLHVPLIVRWPDGAHAGERVREPVSLVDLSPTILSAVGLPVPDGMDGADLVALAADSGVPQRPVYAESFLPRYEFRFSELRAIREGPLKFISAPTVELYDLTADPAERDNLAGARPETGGIEARLRGFVEAEDVDAASRAARGMNRETAEKLRSLGYLAGGGEVVEKPATGARDPKDMTDYMARHDRAIGWISSNRIEDGIALLRELSEEVPENFLVDFKIATAHLAADRPADAEPYLERVVQRAPEHFPSVVMLAEVLALQGKLEAAEARYREAAALAPWAGEPWYQLGGFLRSAGQFGRAAEVFREAVEHEPGSREFATALTDLRISRGDLEIAVAEWEDLARRHPASAAVREESARVHLVRGQPDVAEREAQAALRADPASVGAVAHLADAWIAMGRPADAVARLLSFEELAPASAPLHFALGRALAAQGRFEEADERLAAALRLDPSLGAVYRFRGKLLESRGDREGAAAMYRRALSIRRDDVEAWDALQHLRVP